MQKKNLFKILPIIASISMTTYAFSNTTAVSDQELSQKVNEKIGPGWFSNGYDQINIQVKDGVVTLSGSVRTASEKEKVEREVRNLDGVVSVNSRIRVQEPNGKEERKYPQDSASTPMDEQLNKKIRDDVSEGWLWDSYKEASLNTTNGVVTLEGAVKDMKEQQKLMTKIQKIPGVKSVKSNLRIQEREHNYE